MAIENIMASQPAVDTMTETLPYYGWAPEGKPIEIRLDFGVIDRMSAEVMRGFGSVPKRGAEVGGILLGSVERAGKLIVHIHDFVNVACDYRRGPSYQLTNTDTQRFADAVTEAGQPSLTASAGSEWRPVGYFRSHTRDGMGLTDDDLQLFSNYFPDPTSVMLLVRPFATKVSQAGFFFEENGQIRSDATYLSFPFRRRELGGGAMGEPVRSGEVTDSRSPDPRLPDPRLPDARFAGAERESPAAPAAEETPLREPIPIRESQAKPAIPFTGPPFAAPDSAASSASSPAADVSSSESRRLFGNRDDAPTNFTPSFDVTASTLREPVGGAPSFGVSTEASQKVKKSWVWLPLSSIFLLLGVLVGFLIAITIKRPSTAVPLTAYGLSLAVQQEPDAIHVTWDRAAVPVAIATRGVLHIQDGDFYKAVELKPADLQTGSVIIRNAHSNVTLRLEVFLLERNSLTEVRVVKSVNSR